MDTTNDLADSIKACRTCGIHFVTPTNHHLKHLFQTSQEHSEILLIRLELAQWNVEVSENDGFPQYICNTCIYKFEQVFLLRAACISAQNEFRKFYAVPNGNVTNILIKSEIPDRDEEPAVCDFIYVDELSDGEYDGATPFNIPHIPIKEELIEAATVPMEDSEQPINVVESASRAIIPTDSLHSRKIDFVTEKDFVTVSQTDASLPVSSDDIECNLCQHISSNLKDHKHHMQVVHDVRDLECHICGKEFKNSTSARLKFHMKWHTLSKQRKCNFCAFTCRSKDALNAHKRSNHRKINCKICGKGVLAKKLKSHLHQHELQPKYPCEYCTEAFATENEREDHIWRIHAAEDSSASSLMNNFQTCYTHQVNDSGLNVKPDEIMCQEPQDNFLYKYMCAHCDHRFMKQMDLETHVKEEHRGGVRSTTLESKAAMTVEAARIVAAQGFGEHIVFEKYDNNEVKVTNIIDPPINSSILTPESIQNQTSASFLKRNDNLQPDETHLDSCLSSDEDYDYTENEASNLPTYVDSDLNTFACAKCSETFALIEQLREHHEQHLTAENHTPKISPNKSKFECNFCGKVFDLKFRLNRHINKHMNQALL